MKNKRYSDAQIMGILKQAESAAPVSGLGMKILDLTSLFSAFSLCPRKPRPALQSLAASMCLLVLGGVAALPQSPEPSYPHAAAQAPLLL